MDSWTVTSIGRMKWSVEDFSAYFVVTAPFGSYIALVPRNDNPNRDLFIYDGIGNSVVEDSLSSSYHVISCHWTEDQRLCIFLNDGRALVYLPTDEPRSMMELFSEEDMEAGIRLKEAFVSGLTCCFVSENNEVYFMQKLGEGVAKKAPSLPEDARKAEIAILGILPEDCNMSRNTSIIISVQSGPFRGIMFIINSNSNTTHILVDPDADPFTHFSLHPYHCLSAYCNDSKIVSISCVCNNQTVYDNDCKYCLFKGNLRKAEDRPATPSGEEDEEATEESPRASPQEPSGEPSDEAANEPSNHSLDEPSGEPSGEPTTEPTTEPTAEPSSEPAEAETPLLPHRLYGVYWLNDSTVGLVLSDRHTAAATRVLAVNIHGGIDTLALPFAPAACVFQQEVDGLRVLTPTDILLVRQNHSRALAIPGHLAIASHHTYAEFFLHVHAQFLQGDEAAVRAYREIPADLFEEVIHELLKYCEWDNFNEENTALLAALKLAIMHSPYPGHIHLLCNALYFTCSVIKVLFNLRQEGMPLTHKEYVDLSFPVLIARLLLRNKHLVALRICDIYNSHSNKEHQNENECYFDHFRGIITMDWAMKKIRQSDLPSEQLATMVFTNIIKIGKVPIIPIILNIYDTRPDLAITLLLLESDSNLAVACLLKIGEYHEALRRAVETNNPDVVFAVISYTGDHMDDRDAWFDLISEQEFAEDLFINYYRDMECYDLLNEFYLHTNRYRDTFFLLLSNAIHDVNTTESEDSEFAMDEEDKMRLKVFDLKKCSDMLLPGVNDFEVSCIRNQIVLLEFQNHFGVSILNLPAYGTIINLLARCTEESDQDALKLKNQFDITDVRFDILRLYGYSRGGNWDKVRQLYASRKSIIPIECCLQMVLAKKAYKEGDYYLSIMNLKEAPALALHYALLLNQWKLATKLAVELNDYSSIITIMDNVDNDIPGIRMELYNYTRDRGYERYTPFVNDVKYHPVLKAKKSFASGILAAFTSSDTNGGLRGNGDSSLNEDDGDIISDINKEPSSSGKSGAGIFGLFKKDRNV